MNYREFQETVWQKGRELYRDMPWRHATDPYSVLVSEIMLQQTQVDRVVPKFEQFMATFPTITALADASLEDVLKLWSGLGYNRRAKFLLEAARAVVNDFSGEFPAAVDQLVALPGVGKNTAGAIMAYSHNQPIVFVETNIRTVYFNHFFADRDDITDAELRVVIGETLDTEHPREWYWALMDYGSWLKKQGVGGLARSRHYKKQPPLKGSVREVRGMVLRELRDGALSEGELLTRLPSDERAPTAMAALLAEGLIQRSGDRLHLPRETV